MAKARKAAPRRGASRARPKAGPRVPTWLIAVCGVVVGLFIAFLFTLEPGRETVKRDSVTPQPATRPAEAPKRQSPSYDFYTLLPGQEVPMTDAELEASAQAEREREQRQAQQREQDAAPLAAPDAALPAPTPAPADSASQPAATTTAASAPADTTARYLLQAGSFSASGDAEALKARIALLGLGARVESARVQGRTVYRVRMGPYGTASELADAKGKLEGGGLEALPIKVQ